MGATTGTAVLQHHRVVHQTSTPLDEGREGGGEGGGREGEGIGGRDGRGGGGGRDGGRRQWYRDVRGEREEERKREEERGEGMFASIV